MNTDSATAWAAFNTTLSMCSGFIAFISIGDVQAVGGLIATTVAIVSGCFAIRYYYYVTKEKKQNIKDAKDAKINK